METLTQIIKSLKPGEVRLIRAFYKVQSNGEIKRRLALFDYIKSGKVKNDLEAARAIYKAAPNSAYSHLKARLQRDILNLLLLQDSSKRYDTQYTRALFDARRMLIEGQLLIGRGAYNSGVDVLEKARSLAKKYELYNEGVAINDLLRSHLGVKAGLNTYNKYNEEIIKNLEEQHALLKARDYYHRIIVPNLFHLNRQNQFTEYSEQVLKELKEVFEKNKSANIGYYYYYIGMLYAQLDNKWEDGLEYGKGFLQLVEKEESIRSNSRIAEANLQMASMLIQSGNPKPAIDFAIKAGKFFKKGLLNELQAIELLFFAYYRSKDYKKTEEVIAQAESHPKYKANKTIPARWEYYKANLYFSLGKFDEASALLIQQSELMKDRAGWLLGHKVFELMCMIETKDTYIIDYRTESFRKLLLRQKEENVERAKTILKILETFAKTGLSYKKTNGLEAAKLKLLREGKGDYAWDPTGFELIRFDEWFDSKLAK
ncbi:MAG: hypothetical protein SFW35_11265 [Chitinophagales bacterium]|nr:hypothetical protein [Chitinophagales bacterium]